MPYKCCVPLCKGNLPSGPKVSVFSFPKDNELRAKWITAISRKDFVPNVHSRVCELHFLATDFETEVEAFDSTSGKIISAPLNVKRLRKNTVPTFFSDYPPSVGSKPTPARPSPESKRKKRENTYLQLAFTNSIEDAATYEAERYLKDTVDLQKCLEKFKLDHYWNISTVESDKICIFHLKTVPIPQIDQSVIIENLHLTAFHKSFQLQKIASLTFPYTLNHFNQLNNILDELRKLNSNNCSGDDLNKMRLLEDILSDLKSDSNANMVQFIKEQMQLSMCTKNNLKYSANLMIFSALLHSISPHAYKFIRSSNNMILPHPSTINRVCQGLPISPEKEQHTENFLMYIKSRFKYTSENDRTVLLQIDEVYVKPYFDYKGGTIVGTGHNSSHAAKSAFVFMISSFLSTFEEVAHIVPVHQIEHSELHRLIHDVIIGLEIIGFEIVVVLTDNNSINKKAMSLFATPDKISYVYTHPVNSSRPLFYIIDSVHDFKNIRNSWLNQKNPGKCFFYPKFDSKTDEICTASFNSLNKLYEIETNNLVSYARGLSLKSLSPSSIERQNVKLVLKIFNKFVPEALRLLGPQNKIPHHEDTANFIEIINKWWSIMNVKYPIKGILQRDEFSTPLTNSENDPKVIFLNKFLDWLEAWKKMGCTTGALTKQTHEALYQTTHGILELADYCIKEKNFTYILTGKIQTDNLEARFGKYRQLAGAQYNVSMRQVLECEKKLRLQSIAAHEIPTKSGQLVLNEDDKNEVESKSLFKCDITITNNDIEEANKYLKILTYIAGYCCHSVLKKIKCLDCKEFLTVDSEIVLSQESFKLIKIFDRGGLKCPSNIVVNHIMYCYIVTLKLQTSEIFLKSKNHRNIITTLTSNILEEFEMLGNNEDYICMNHSESNISHRIIWIAANVFLKNLVTIKNDNIIKYGVEKKVLAQKKAEEKKRKLAILSH